MTDINVTLRDGSKRNLTANGDATLMEALRQGGVDEILALCGGCCSCSTCHVYVEDASGELTPVSEDEDDLLDSSNHRRPGSRLACQVRLTADLAAISIEVAPED